MNARLPFPDTPITPEHARQLDERMVSLTPEEAWWISGFLAGFARQGNRPAEATPPVGAALTILYGSETGHSAELARRAEALAHARGLAARAEDMADFRPQAIAKARHLIVITSTHGEGDPPNSAIPFNEFILGRRAPRLDGPKFAVLGLGDSSYERFCRTARNLDERLAALGAERVHERAECDVDYRSQAEAWIDAVLDAFAPALLTRCADAARCPRLIRAPLIRDAKCGRLERRTVPGAHFLWLVLPHVLPKGFRRARNFGFLHPNCKRLIALLQVLLKFVPAPPLIRERPPMLCACCGAAMAIVNTRLPAFFAGSALVPPATGGTH